MLTLKDLLIIEDNPEVFNFRFGFDDVLMWPFIRFGLHNIPFSREYKFANSYTSKEILRFVDKMLYLKNTIVNNPYKINLKAKYDILMFCSGITNVKKGNKYFNRLSEYFANMYKDKTLLIEDSARRKYYTPRFFPNICYHDFINLKAYIKSRFLKPPKKDVVRIKSLLRFLEQNYRYKLEKSDLDIIENALLRISKRLKIYYYLYNKLFDRYNPKIIFLEDASYGARSYILKWAKARNIITIEPQHGLVSENHMAYNYGSAILNSDIYKMFLPDYFLTYGKYWTKAINLPVRKVTIGNPNYSENIRKLSLRRRDNTKTKILFISEGVTSNIIKEIVLKVSSIVDINKYDILFRPHPSELPMLKDRYAELLATDKIKIDTVQDIYLSLHSTDFVAGGISTVLFEAIGFCKSVFAINHPFTDLNDPKNILRRFSNAEELINLIKTHNFGNEINKDYIWELNWEIKYKNFMNSLLGL